MYCIKCGVKLADTEKKCPLCNTVVYHPDFTNANAQPLYPSGKKPEKKSGTKAINGVIIFLFLLPVVVCVIADLMHNGILDWSGYVTGALVLSYIALALPQWFDRPNPVIFVPCDFAALGLYLWYINFATGGNWFWSFALPVTGGFALITCAVVTLLRYLRKGKLYVFGGAFAATGAFMLLIEYLMIFTFDLNFTGWSFYPMASLVLIGALLIYLAINKGAREIMERKLFF